MSQMEPESKVAPEAISVPIPDDLIPIPDDLKELYRRTRSAAYDGISSGIAALLIERIARNEFEIEAARESDAAVTIELAELRERIASLTAQVATLESERDFAVRSADIANGKMTEMTLDLEALRTVSEALGHPYKNDPGHNVLDLARLVKTTIATLESDIALLHRNLGATRETAVEKCHALLRLKNELFSENERLDEKNAALEQQVATLEQQLDAQSFPERFAIWKALGFPEGHQGDLVAAVAALKESHADLTEVLTGIQWQVTNGRLCYFGDHTGYEPQISSAQVERWSDALARARSLSAPTKEQQGGVK